MKNRYTNMLKNTIPIDLFSQVNDSATLHRLYDRTSKTIMK